MADEPTFTIGIEEEYLLVDQALPGFGRRPVRRKCWMKSKSA